MSDNEFLTSAQAAELLGVSNQSLKNWHQSGAFVPALVTPTGHRRYSKTQIEEYLKQRKGK